MKKKIAKATFLCLTLMVILPASHARMYQWEQPQSGIIQLSGVAPAWYRSVHPGPRILVFDNGRLIDDTDLRVSDLHRIALREKALGEQAADEAIAAVEPARSPDESLKVALTEAAKSGVNVEELAAQALAAAEAEKPPTANTVQATVDELKALLSRWDIAKSNAARSLLGNPQQENPASDERPTRFNP